MMFKKIMCIGFLLASVFCLSLVFASNANAYNDDGDIFSRFKKPLPDLKLLSKKEFNRVTKPISKKPYGQNVLAYNLRIPKGWVEREDKSSSNFSLSDKLFLELNVYYGKPTISGRSRLEIQALNLDSNLTAEQWYLKYILIGGYTVESFVTHSKNKVESLMVVMDRDFSYYVRTVVVFNGDKAIMAKYYVPIHYMNDQAALQAQVLQSFSVVNYINRTIGKTKSYRFLDIAELQYPDDWKVYAKPLRSVDRIETTIMNLNELSSDGFANRADTSTDGKLEIRLVAAAVQDSLVDEIKVYKQKLETSGILIGDKLTLQENLVYGENIDFAITEVYTGIDSANSLSEYEYWFTVMVGGNYYYFFTLLTPSRNERFAVWAENTQSYRQIIKSFKLMGGAFMERDY